MSSITPVIDYEGSHYKTDFWVNQGREYEDQVERLVLKRLLPPRGRRIVEIGAGFGRLAHLYEGYDQVILFDYSRSLLEEAVSQLGNDPRFIFVAGNVYELPFANHSIDTLVMVRVMHHLADVPKALKQLYRVTHSESTSVIEYASKRNLKSILRWVIGQQSWSPFTEEPYEFVELNFDFHPAWMDRQFQEVGLNLEEQLAVSHFRLASLKRHLPSNFLAQLDNAISNLGGLYPLSPSIFVKAEDSVNHRMPIRQSQVSQPSGHESASVAFWENLFCCPSCGVSAVDVEQDTAKCDSCSASYRKKGEIWDFKEKIL